MFKIAITQRVYDNPTYTETRDALSQDWTMYLQNLIPGGIILPVPNSLPNSTDWLSATEPDAIVLSNGEDWTGHSNRDHVEKELYKCALAADLPILGVCRGLQVINLQHGGKFIDDVQAQTGTNHVGPHDISILDKTFVDMLGTDQLQVNSFHNAAVLMAGLSTELRAFAQCGDVIEGLFHPAKKVLAIQWHPERQGNGGPHINRMIKNFMMGTWSWLS